MAAWVRFFCVVGPRRPRERKDKHWWPDISHSYLTSLRLGKVSVRAIPIGPTFLTLPKSDQWKHWSEVFHFFVTELDKHFVNIVCCPPGLKLGKRMAGRSFAPSRVVGVQGEQIPSYVVKDGKRATTEIVYDPEFALAGYYTLGVSRNIAITAATPEPSPAEIAALKRYDSVLCPTEEDAEELRHLGVLAGHYPHEKLEIESSAIPWLRGTDA